MKSASQIVKDRHQQNIIRLCDRIDSSHSRWEIFSDFMHMTAIAISNRVDWEHAPEREKRYIDISQKYREVDQKIFAEMFREIVEGMENDPKRDFLGELYMNMDLGNKHTGQFFTPYTLCEAMAKINAPEDLKEKINEQGWISVNDPACGAGALLVAFANHCREKSIDFQSTVLFVAQDIDFLVGCMCYIQLSLLGCPGYVVIGNTLTEPSTCLDERGLFPVDKGNVWYTPMFYSQVWDMRRTWCAVDLLLHKAAQTDVLQRKKAG